MNARALIWVAAGLAAIGAGCDSGNRTVLVLEINSNFQVPVELDKINVEATARGRMTHQLPFALGGKGGYTLPLRVGLLPPDGDLGAELTILAKGIKGTNELAHEDAVVSFLKGQSRVIKIFLAKECAGFPCPAGQTCTGGPMCVPIRRDPTDAGQKTDGPLPDVPANADVPSGGDVPAGTDVPSGVDVPPGVDVPAGVDAPPVEAGGDACVCPQPSNPCLRADCQNGACVTGPVVDMTPCPSGVCWKGACCTGCIGAGVCQPGTQVDACGGAGKTCLTCDDKNPCTRDLCSAAACDTEKLTGGTCPTGVCVAGVCACGGPGEPCCAAAPACKAALVCQNGTCGQCGAVGQDCCPGGNPCASGLVCGATSMKCEPCGDLTQACCTAGTACRMGVCNAAKVCQACGAVGQPCCAGNSCLSDNDLCNGSEICQSGTCGRANPVVCTASDQCHNAGTCAAATGQCSNPVKTPGTPCNDANMCTTGETCQNGACTSGAAVNCNDNNPCTTDSCAPATGCAHPNVGSGTACTNDNNACTSDVCNASGMCTHPAIGNGTRCTLANGLNGVCSGTSCVQCLANGDCGNGQVCKADNTCCTLTPNPCANIQCGTGSNGCGGTVLCDTCPSGKVCDRRCDLCLTPPAVCP